MVATKAHVFVLLDHGRGTPGAASEPVTGSRHRHNPYGYLHAAGEFRITLSRDRPESRITSFVRRGLKACLGFDLIHALRNLDGIRDANVLWTHTEKEHLAVSLLQILRLVPRRQVIAQSIWIWDGWSRFGPVRRTVYRMLLRNECMVHTTHSPENATKASMVLRRPAIVVPFGIENSFQVGASSVHHDPVRIIAPGNDRHRDWKLLQDVARLRPEWLFIAYSGRRRARSRRSPKNYRVLQLRSRADVKAAFLAASVVAVPLKENGHASGLTVILESIQCERRVVATSTGGLHYYFADRGILTSARTAHQFAEAIDSALGNHSLTTAGWLLEAGLTDYDYAARHTLMTRSLLARGEVSPEVAEAVSRVASIDVEVLDAQQGSTFE